MGPGPDIRKMVSHERKWGRFPLTHGQRISGREREGEEFTENDHQKNPTGSRGGQEVGLMVCFWNCLCACVVAQKFSCWGRAP